MLATRDPILGIPGNLWLLLAILIAAFAFFLPARKLWRLMRLGRPELRWDQPGERTRGFLRHVLGQGRMFQEPISGVMHALIFWGFIVITIMTVTMILTGLFPGLTVPFIERNPVFLVTLEVFQFLVLGAVGFAFFRRLVLQPRRLNFSADALIILSLIVILMVTAFGATASAIAVEPHDWDRWSFLSAGLASLFATMGVAGALLAHKVFWWGHVLTVLAFGAYLPHSKHLHIVTSGPNVWLRSLLPKGQLPYLDVENALEEEAPLGASDLRHLKWKDLLDTYTCTECGRCEAECPASRTGKPLSPKKLILDLKEHLLQEGPALLDGKSTEGPAAAGHPSPSPEHGSRQLVGQVITQEVLWDCTTCRACMEACPVFIEHVPKIVEMRRHLVMTESRFEPELQRLFDNLEAAGNPWRFPRADRAKWADGLGVPVLGEDVQLGDVEVLYWVGCAGSYDERNQKVARALATVLKMAGVRFAILGQRETCTGDPARRAGHEYLFQMLGGENVQTLNDLGDKTILASCPHCFNTIKEEYPQLGGHYRVRHHAEYLGELVSQGRLKPSTSMERDVAYHDPCYLGRYHDIYDQPRAALRAIPGVRLKEIQAGCRRNAMCCGAGGAKVFFEERRGARVNHLRTEQIQAENPGQVAVACPYCMIMLEDGTRARGVYEELPVLDVAELLERSIGQPAKP